MKAIKAEAKTFLDESYLVQFHNLCLPIPEWWTIVEQTDQSLKFMRTDTRYDWFARFTWHESTEEKTLPDILKDYIETQELDYDKDDVAIETDSRVIFRDPKIQEYLQEVIRVEGKASEKIVDRVYMDIVIIRPLNEKGYFLFESRSSVLNGSLEGPFYEEALAHIALDQ